MTIRTYGLKNSSEWKAFRIILVWAKTMSICNLIREGLLQIYNIRLSSIFLQTKQSPNVPESGLLYPRTPHPLPQPPIHGQGKGRHLNTNSGFCGDLGLPQGPEIFSLLCMLQKILIRFLIIQG